MRKTKWYKCPYCGYKIIEYDKDNGVARGIYRKCPYCKRKIEIKFGYS